MQHGERDNISGSSHTNKKKHANKEILDAKERERDLKKKKSRIPKFKKLTKFYEKNTVSREKTGK